MGVVDGVEGERGVVVLVVMGEEEEETVLGVCVCCGVDVVLARCTCWGQTAARPHQPILISTIPDMKCCTHTYSTHNYTLTFRRSTEK